MFKLFVSIVAICVIYTQVNANELAYESSPYLQQHKNNPINWLPYSEEAFIKAKEEDKPVFLSIGYSTCHWCHVMAKESFENKELAELFNTYFICIKVDREEMPHLDSYYQKLFLKLKKHSGGWPLSVFMTPEKQPFYIATYIPPKREHFHEGLDTLLLTLYKKYKNNHAAVLKQAAAMQSVATSKLQNTDTSSVSLSTLQASIEKDIDTIYGGFSRNRKFPQASKLALLMDISLISNEKKLQEQAYKMLDVMALRGLYDHIEGGFFRYATDAAWEIPHFEKMLYNQAELIPLYVRGFLVTNKKLYADVVDETIQMLDKRFVDQELYLSASDADSDHKEGEYFIFSIAEVKDALAKNPYAKEIEKALDLSMRGNFEGKVHINFLSDKRPKGFDRFKQELLNIRKEKTYPFIDTKINTAWNAMMIEALYKASIIDEKYAKKADRHLQALLDFMFIRGELYHQSIANKEPTQLGLLEDYSFLISALIAGYEVDFDKKKLDLAEYLLRKAIHKFYKNGVWYLSDDEFIVEAGVEDKYYTSALGKMLQNLLNMASLTESRKYEKVAFESLKNMQNILTQELSNAPSLAIAFLMKNIEVVTLKGSRQALKQNKLKIATIKYPYLLKKPQRYNEYLACTMRSCFAIDKNLDTIQKTIEEKIRK